MEKYLSKLRDVLKNTIIKLRKVAKKTGENHPALSKLIVFLLKGYESLKVFEMSYEGSVAGAKLLAFLGGLYSKTKGLDISAFTPSLWGVIKALLAPLLSLLKLGISGRISSSIQSGINKAEKQKRLEEESGNSIGQEENSSKLKVLRKEIVERLSILISKIKDWGSRHSMALLPVRIVLKLMLWAKAKVLSFEGYRFSSMAWSNFILRFKKGVEDNVDKLPWTTIGRFALKGLLNKLGAFGALLISARI
jgi:hypothetical protein